MTAALCGAASKFHASNFLRFQPVGAVKLPPFRGWSISEQSVQFGPVAALTEKMTPDPNSPAYPVRLWLFGERHKARSEMNYLHRANVPEPQMASFGIQANIPVPTMSGGSVGESRRVDDFDLVDLTTDQLGDINKLIGVLYRGAHANCNWVQLNGSGKESQRESAETLVAQTQQLLTMVERLRPLHCDR
jgi:hypothetical protein